MAIAKPVRSRLKFSRSVVAAGRTHADGIVVGIQTLHGADAIDPAATRNQILTSCDLLARTTDQYATDNQVLDQELTEDILARQRCEQTAGFIGDILVTVRGCVRDRLGPESLRIYRLDERNPQGREGLARYAADVQGLLQQNPVTLTDVLGSSIATVDLAANIGEALTTYRGALDDVAREALETQRARAIRDRTEQRFRRVLQNVAAIIIAYLRLAGMDELAARLRAIPPRPGVTPGDDQPGDDSPDIDLPEPEPEPPVAAPVTAG